MDLSLIASVLSAAGVGSIVGSAISQGKDRRESRARVLGAVHVTEEERWAPSREGALMAALRELETSALVARMPQAVVRQYIILARAAAEASAESFEQSGGDPEFGSGIETEFARLVRDSARLIVKTAWRPSTAVLLSTRYTRAIDNRTPLLNLRDQERLTRYREYG